MAKNHAIGTLMLLCQYAISLKSQTMYRTTAPKAKLWNYAKDPRIGGQPILLNR